MTNRNMHCPKDPRVECLLPGPTLTGGCCRYIPLGEPCNFTVIYRNPGHWDITTSYGRAFRIRGEYGSVIVADERADDLRPHPRQWHSFKTVSAALLWCAEELMTFE